MPDGPGRRNNQMDNLHLYHELEAILRNDSKYCMSDGALIKNKIVEDALSLNPVLLHYLLSHEGLKKAFFSSVSGTLVFDKVKFQQFVMNKSFLPDSYTAFKNKIGLTTEDGRFISESREIVLSWPYKDCILEGGQTKEDSKRDEVFWSETLAPDDVTRLTEPKALSRFKLYDKDGEKTVEHIDFKDNLVIKGNNLLTLYTLRQKLANCIKMIYIDPPYNTKGDANTFAYNNNFNHSSWLTFMKNRLEVAKDLLQTNGVIAITIDDVEFAYLKVLCDSVFGVNNFIGTLVVQIKPSGRTNDAFLSTCHEYVMFYAKDINHAEINFVPLTEEQRRQYSEGGDTNPHKWRDFLRTGGYSTPEERPNSYYPIYYCPETNDITLEAKQGYVEILPIDSVGKRRVWRKTRDSLQMHLDANEIKVVNNNGVYKVKIIDKIKSGIRPKSMWTDSKYDASTHGTKLLKTMFGGDSGFSFPKSLYSVKDVIYLFTETDENDIVLDFFAGSGTTGHAVMELNKDDKGNRSFILCEQMDYINSVTVPRLNKVIESEEDEAPHHSFIYCELANANSNLVSKIQKANTDEDIMAIWEDLKNLDCVSYKVKIGDVDILSPDFVGLTIEEKKRFLIECLDKNLLYVPARDIDSEEYSLSDEDKRLTREFYKMA